MVKVDWDKWPNGDVAVHPLVGWETATFMKGQAGALRLVFAVDQTLKKFGATQLVLTSAQLRELAKVLTTMAGTMDRRVEAQKPKGKPN